MYGPENVELAYTVLLLHQDANFAICALRLAILIQNLPVCAALRHTELECTM